MDKPERLPRPDIKPKGELKDTAAWIVYRLGNRIVKDEVDFPPLFDPETQCDYEDFYKEQE